MAPMAPDGYAFSRSGDTITASLYAGGTFVEVRDTFDATAYPAWGGQYLNQSIGIQSRSIILTDSDGNVGDGSLLFVGDDTKLVVWDVEGATSYVRTSAAGYHIGGAVFDSGFVYWLETEDSAHTGNRYAYVRLMRARSDFSGVSTIATHTIDGSANDGIACDGFSLRRTSTGCWARVYFLMGETSPDRDVWLADSGSTDEQAASLASTDGTQRTGGDAVFGAVPYYQEAAIGTETPLYPSASVGGDHARNLVGSVYQSYNSSLSISYRWSTTGDPDATTADSIVTLDNAEDVYYLFVE